MDFEFDRSFSTDQTSSVIDTIYYNSEDNELVVKLLTEDWYGDQILAGYTGVPADVFTAMELINKRRIDGDQTASVGRYWNEWVKPNFSGFGTSHIDDFVDIGSPIVEDEPVTAGDQPVPPIADTEWVIQFDDFDEDDSVIALRAKDELEAIRKFWQIVEIAQWSAVNVTAITHIF